MLDLMNINKLNEEIKRCRKCKLSETRMNVLCGEGKLDAALLLIAQAPGEKEDKTGRMFVGPSGKVLEDLLKGAGISRGDIYMTNLIKCMLPKYRKPKPDETKACTEYLDQEIELVNPKVLVPLGYYAFKYVFERYGSGRYLQSEFSTLCGKLSLLDKRKTFVLRHPSALLHNPQLKAQMLKNYHRLGVLGRECKWYQACPMKRYYEQGKLDRKWIELYCKGYWRVCKRYKMEESGQYHLDWMLPDGSIDEQLKEGG